MSVLGALVALGVIGGTAAAATVPTAAGTTMHADDPFSFD